MDRFAGYSTGLAAVNPGPFFWPRQTAARLASRDSETAGSTEVKLSRVLREKALRVSPKALLHRVHVGHACDLE